MRNFICCCTILFVTSLAVTALHAKATNTDPLNDPDVQKTLRAMADASTWYHPDLFGEYAGMRRYAHHDYAGALKYFKIGAYYADKLSQLSIGLMYANGDGVKKDAETAYAWLNVAAERGYPEFVATRDRVKASLTPAQLQDAQKRVADVQARYGDAVAKPRMEQQLRFGMERMTGSRTGFDFGALHMAAKQNCGTGKSIGDQAVPVAGCGGADIYSRWRWEPKRYFAMRDAQWKATVSVGALGADGNPADKAKSQAAGKVANAKPDNKKP